jgi:cysteinyl-tRNA synthetase
MSLKRRRSPSPIEGRARTTTSFHEITELIDLRARALAAGDILSASEYREELLGMGVLMNDKMGLWWRNEDYLIGFTDDQPLEPETVDALIFARELVRRDKLYDVSDRIRDMLGERGVKLNDRDKAWWFVDTSHAGTIPVVSGIPPRQGFELTAFTATEEFMRMLVEREKARHLRDFQKGDRLRELLRLRGVTIDDSGGTWRAADGRSGSVRTAATETIAELRIPVSTETKSLLTADIEAMVLERQRARKHKDFAKADSIR